MRRGAWRRVARWLVGRFRPSRARSRSFAERFDALVDEGARVTLRAAALEWALLARETDRVAEHDAD